MKVLRRWTSEGAELTIALDLDELRALKDDKPRLCGWILDPERWKQLNRRERADAVKSLLLLFQEA